MARRPPNRYSPNRPMAQKEIIIGRRIIDGKFAGPFKIDVMRLLVSRALITSSSGGGKSYLLRRMLETLSAVFPLIVFDPEGEFASLREIVDLVLVGPDGEVPADPTTAGMLCKHLVENRVSAVIDLSELTPSQRRDYIANFITTMLELPKKFWTPYIVSIDEIHEYAPNNKSEDECKKAIELLYSKGRKRGFCAIGATQRVANVSPNITAESKTRFIGQISYDNDLQRASDFLGWSKTDWPRLRDLSPPGHEGQFFAVGPALCDRGVVMFRSDKVRTHHPRPGEGSTYTPPQPSAKLSGVLRDLRDLPTKVAEEKATLESLTEKNKHLEKTVRDLNKIATTSRPTPITVKVPTGDPTLVRRFETAKNLLETAMAVIKRQSEALTQSSVFDEEKIRNIVQTAVSGAVTAVVRLGQAGETARLTGIKKLQTEAEKLAVNASKLLQSSSVSVANVDAADVSNWITDPFKEVKNVQASENDDVDPPDDADAEDVTESDDDDDGDALGSGSDASLAKGERKVLKAIGQFGSLMKNQLFTLTGYKSTTIKNALTGLRVRGYIVGGGNGPFKPTDAGKKAMGKGMKPLPTGKALAKHWLARLGQGEKTVLTLLIKHYPKFLSNDQIETATSYASTSRKNITTSLNARMLIEKSKEGIKASDALFD